MGSLRPQEERRHLADAVAHRAAECQCLVGGGLRGRVVPRLEMDLPEQLESLGLQERVADGSLLLEAVGPVTARPLEDVGLAVSYPDRWRLGALVRELVKHYGDERMSKTTRAGILTVRATTAVLDGKPLPLSPSGFAILQALAAANGSVVTREQLSTVMPSGQGGAHAVEAAINRLREASQARTLVRTVVKRGYALAVAA